MTVDADGRLVRRDHAGQRLTSCCGCYSTYSDDTLCCRKCYEAVGPGEGDGSDVVAPAYTLAGREAIDEEQVVYSGDCAFCGTRIAHVNDGGIGWGVGAMVDGHPRYFLICETPPCAARTAATAGEKPETPEAERVVWRCGCVQDFVENLGDLCHACGVDKAHAVPWEREPEEQPEVPGASSKVTVTGDVQLQVFHDEPDADLGPLAAATGVDSGESYTVSRGTPIVPSTPRCPGCGNDDTTGGKSLTITESFRGFHPLTIDANGAVVVSHALLRGSENFDDGDGDYGAHCWKCGHVGTLGDFGIHTAPADWEWK